MRRVLKTISFLTAGAILLMAALVFVCPHAGMSTMGQKTNTSVMSGLCQEVGSSVHNDCLAAHLTIAQRFLGIPVAQVFLLSLILVVTALFAYILLAYSDPRIKTLIRYYIKHGRLIRAYSEQKVRAWLMFVGNETAASVA